MSHSFTIEDYELNGRSFNIQVDYEVEWDAVDIGSNGRDIYGAVVTDYDITFAEEITEDSKVEVKDEETLLALLKAISDEVDSNAEGLDEPEDCDPADFDNNDDGFWGYEGD